MRGPTRHETRAKLTGLIDGELSRAEASDWAMHFVAAKRPEVDDPAVWAALNALAGADSPTSDREWLFGEADFRAWLADFDAAPT